MSAEWSNWSGSLRFTPQRIVEPRTDDEVAQLIHAARARGQKFRVVGAGHSSAPLARTSGTLISLRHFQGISSHDRDTGEATVRAGMVIHDTGAALRERGLAMHNTGDVDVQTLAGAIGTGTHGTGHMLGNLSTMLLGGRWITGAGEIQELRIGDDPALVRAARVALGMLGIVTELRVRVLPAFQLRRQEWCTHTDACLTHLAELIARNRNFDFYWYPRSDLAKLRIMNEPGRGLQNIPYAKRVLDRTGWSDEILPRKRTLKFDEMEYALLFDAGPSCFAEVRRRVKLRWRRDVAWRVLYRTVAADDSWLSPATGRDTVTISLHHNAGLPYDAYCADIEPVFRDFGGRPHWGKKHTLTSAALEPLYPLWQQFRALRRQHDPDDVFLTAEMQSLLEADRA